MKFIHISDVHLNLKQKGDTAWEKNLPGDVEESFSRVLDACNKEEADLLLIAGNLFDAPPSVQDLEMLDEKLKKLVKTRTILLAGDQDWIRPGSAEAAYHFKSRTVMLPPGRTTNAYLRGINTCVTGFSYGKPGYTERILEGIRPGRPDAVNILLGCGGDAEHMPFDREKIAGGRFDYAALGGRHHAEHILKNRVAYSGMPEPLSPADTGRHGYIYGEITEEGTKIRFVPSALREFVRVQVTLRPGITGEEISGNLEEKLLKMGTDNVYTLIFRGFSQGDFRPDLSRIRSRFQIAGITNLTISRKDAEILEEENRENLIGRYIQSIEESYGLDENIRNKTLRYGLEALIMAGDER